VDGSLIIAGKQIALTAERDPLKLPWAEQKVDVVIESTGHFTDSKGAGLHITAGAKRVVISAPAKSGDEKVQTFVIGANADKLNDAVIVSNASCTTNCIAPLMRVLQDELGVEKSLMTTVHSYTASQVLQDAPAKDLRESRSAAENIVPTTTGAAIAAALTVPELKDKFDGMSVRVPTPVVSLSDITFVAKRKTTVEEVNKILRHASTTSHRGIIRYSEEELVSADYKGDSHSAIVDAKLTNVVQGDLVKVVAWYDNEWGYSNRLVELAELVGNSTR
jgi:glyceraldehyde 3-phosphate dehydrogenase